MSATPLPWQIILGKKFEAIKEHGRSSVPRLNRPFTVYAIASGNLDWFMSRCDPELGDPNITVMVDGRASAKIALPVRIFLFDDLSTSPPVCGVIRKLGGETDADAFLGWFDPFQPG